MNTPISCREWLEADGLGGFASGTSTGIRTRRYHALLLTATAPPAGRMVLVNGFDAWIETNAGRIELTSQHYAPDVIGGDGAQRIERFTTDPWPRWVLKLDEDTQVEQEVLVAHEAQLTQVSCDAALRPNQIFAVGGLPFQIIDGEPLGLRSLAPGEPGYKTHYQGGVWERDSAYHQGTVWRWLIGPFVEAWVRVRGNNATAKAQARAKFLTPLLTHLDDAGLGHVSEIADADAPHAPRGCPFQAWSMGELLRLNQRVLTEPSNVKPSRKRTRELVTT